MAAKLYTYPHYEINVKDNSVYTASTRETLPLLRPIFFMRTQQGPVGVPVWCSDGSAAQTIFGSGTFDSKTPYYSREALYLGQIFNRQGAYICRLANEDAKTGSLVLQLQVKRTQVTQYQRDENGQFIVDPITGQYVPETDGSAGTVLTEEGYELKWSVRPLADGETYTAVKPTTYNSGDTTYTVYPILAVQATSPGAYANDTGFKFFCDIDNIDDTMATNVGAMPYTFGAVRKPYGSDTPSAINSQLGDQTQTFVAKPNAVDERSKRYVSFTDILTSEYPNLLPWNIYLYSENIEAIGKLIMAVEADDDPSLTDPYLVNLVEPINVEGIPYGHVAMSTDPDAINLDENYILYLQNGADGTMTDELIEELTRTYLAGVVYPELMDSARYQFTHIFDTGVSIETKYAFIDFLSQREDIKIILSTQTIAMGRLNTAAEDLSTGAALYARCLLQPESSLKGTPCFRAEIYMQAGYLVDGSAYTGFIPSTYDVLIKKSRYASTTSLTGTPGGLPNSDISVFDLDRLSYTPVNSESKQRAWDGGLNYFQYYNQNAVHWPAMRTVYQHDTSVLSDATFSDVVVYTKHIVREIWAQFTGTTSSFDQISTRASAALTSALSSMMNGLYRSSVNFYQTEDDRKLGYKAHCTVQLWANGQQRVWVIDIETNRENYNGTSSSATA